MIYASVWLSVGAEAANVIDTAVKLYTVGGSAFTGRQSMVAVEAWVTANNATLTPVTADTLSITGGGILINRYGQGHIIVLAPSSGQVVFRNTSGPGARTRFLHVVHRGMVYRRASLVYT